MSTMIQTNIATDKIRQSARHVLFVEGRDTDNFDPVILKEFLHGMIEVKPLGDSVSIRSAAQALFQEHPEYYFLIDRDHYSDERVDESWRKFPDPKTSNILIWRRRELENYFLIPEYLEKSDYLSCSKQELINQIAKSAQKRIYLDAVNIVIIGIREEMKYYWIECPKTIGGFANKQSAKKKLLEMTEFELKRKGVLQLLDRAGIETRYNEVIRDLFCGASNLRFGRGKWLEMVKGKKVLESVIEKCFKVKDADGNLLEGKQNLREKTKAVLKNLLRKPINDQPDDFKKLYELIEARVKS